VHFYKCTQLTHCYTIEASYFRGTNTPKNSQYYKDFTNPTTAISNLKIILGQNKIHFELTNLTENNNNQINLSQDLIDPTNHQNSLEFYHPKIYEKMGRELLISVLDYEELNPFSKVFSSEFQNVYNIRKFISIKLSQDDSRFKNNNLIQNLIKDINYVKTFTSLYEKFSQKLETKSIIISNTMRNKDIKKPLEDVNMVMKNSTKRETISKTLNKDNLTPEKNKSSILLKTDDKDKNKMLSNQKQISRKEENIDAIISKDDNCFVKKNYINLTLPKKNNVDNYRLEKQKLPFVKPQIINQSMVPYNYPKAKSNNCLSKSFLKPNEMNIEANIQYFHIKSPLIINTEKNNENKMLSLKDLPSIQTNSRQLNNPKKF